MSGDCPAPFVEVSFPTNYTIPDLFAQHRYCWSNNCCLPCLNDSLIIPNARSVADKLNSISCVSFVLMAILTILLLMFPVQLGRTKYNMGLAIGLTFFHAPEMVNLFGSLQATLCSDDTAKAVASSNWRCALQGSLVVYGSLSTILWSAMRIMTLHCALAYRIVLSGQTETASMIFICSVVPLFHVILGFVTNAITYQAGHICTPTIDLTGFFTFWGVDLLIVFPVLLVYISTFVIIARIVRKQRHVGGYRASGSLQNSVVTSSDDRARLKRLAGNRPSIGSTWAFVKLEWRPFVSFAMTTVNYSSSLKIHRAHRSS